MTEYYEKLSDVTANSIVITGHNVVVIHYVKCPESNWYQPGSFYDRGYIKGYVEFKPRLSAKGKRVDLDDYYIKEELMPIVIGFTTRYQGTEYDELWVKTDKGFTKKAFKTTIKVTMEEII